MKMVKNGEEGGEDDYHEVDEGTRGRGVTRREVRGGLYQARSIVKLSKWRKTVRCPRKSNLS